MSAGRDRLVERATHGDYEAAGALEILGSPMFTNDGRVWAHVDTDGIDWEAILGNGSWSSGEHRLLELGAALWRGHGPVDVVYVFTCLSDGYLQVAIDAITARRGYQPLPASSAVIA